MNSFNIDALYKLSEFDDFDLEDTRVVDELFELEAASEIVYDAFACSDSGKKFVWLSLYVDAESTAEATAKAQQVFDEAIRNAAKATWTWRSTEVRADDFFGADEDESEVARELAVQVLLIAQGNLHASIS